MKFSVAMCVYAGDSAAHFVEALQSVLEQSVRPDEVVLVVDGPIGNDLAFVIDRYEELSCFQVIRLPENQGHGMARRTGIAACTQELIAIMDADDICQPNRFALQLDCFAKHPEFDVVGGNIEEFFDGTGEKAGCRMVPESNQEIYRYMRSRCPFNQMTVMLKKHAVEAAGGYLDWFCDEDYYLWIRMALQNCRFYNLQQILVRVRVDANMYQRRGGWQYFLSEYRLQNYMRKHQIIGRQEFIYNNAVRLVVQVLLPNRLRGFVFKHFARN
jgi:glycosyltransferase involved in cell wall biosynthesis